MCLRDGKFYEDGVPTEGRGWVKRSVTWGEDPVTGESDLVSVREGWSFRVDVWVTGT